MAKHLHGFVSGVPATTWEHALISGNGSLGALVFGDPAQEIITLSHERLFMPLSRPLPPVNTARHFNYIRHLLLQGQYQSAADLVVQEGRREGYADLQWTDPLTPAFDLRLYTEIAGDVTSYERSVDFNTGVVTVCWDDEQGECVRRLFVSRADNIVVLSITHTGLHLPDYTCELATTDPYNLEGEKAFETGIESVEITADETTLGYRSRFRRHWPGSLQGYEGVARVLVKGGHTSTNGRSIVAHAANEILIIAGLMLDDASAHTHQPDPWQWLYELPTDFAQLLARHVSVHSPLFNRVSLNLGGRSDHALPSEELLALARQGDLRPALIEKVFDAGRYAIIASSGELPPTLQGVWTGTWAPLWSGDYTQNGNLQCALASLLSSNTPELMLAYFNYLEALRDDFRENARRLYGCRGIYLPSRTSTHGLQNHFNENWCHTFWTAGAGWATRLFYDYWQYTGDLTFLATRALPFMEEVAAFYEDFLLKGADDRWVFAPSYSPENTPANSNSQACINATMDIAIAKEVFRHLIKASSILRANEDKIVHWEAILQAMPGYPINADGALAEWAWPGIEDNNAHRHVSHLYPVLYENDAEIANNPDLVKACQQVIQRRMAFRRTDDTGEMAFGLVQLGMAAAHLRMTDIAYEIVVRLSTFYWRPSLVSTHDAGAIFNVDICGGLPALIIEMLIQSQWGSLDLLPTLPDQWPTGTIKGIACRGQVLIESLSWRQNHIRVVLHSAIDQQLIVNFASEVQDLHIQGVPFETTEYGSKSRLSLPLPANLSLVIEADRT